MNLKIEVGRRLQQKRARQNRERKRRMESEIRQRVRIEEREREKYGRRLLRKDKDQEEVSRRLEKKTRTCWQTYYVIRTIYDIVYTLHAMHVAFDFGH